VDLTAKIRMMPPDCATSAGDAFFDHPVPCDEMLFQAAPATA
jgi:hypothetical protein